jgi:P27 family predicted phage terminase small subunit
MARGAKRKTTKEKKLKGTSRPSRENPLEPEADEALPVPPPDLCPEERAYFLTIVGRLDKINVASATDSELITQIARRLWEIEELVTVIREEGRVVESFNPKTNQVLLRTHPAVGQRNEAQRHLQSLLAECGLTPAARSKVSAKEPPKKSSPFVGRDKSVN